MKRKEGNQNTSGICKLTRERGRFVKAHLIPKALTKLAEKSEPFLQIGMGVSPVRRWTSWYDPELVTQTGEKILTELDTWAIAEFRRHKLIWSSWGTKRTLGEFHHPITSSPWGIRKVKGVNPRKLRLFFLSLLWRAAATNRSEFAAITMPADHLEQLRIMLCSRNPEPLSFYPAQLTQLSTIGVMHNYAPSADIKRIRSLEEGGPGCNLPIYRFYLDGLVAHVHRHASDDGFTSSLGDLIVGADNNLIVSTQTFESSLQERTVNIIVTEALGFRSQTRSTGLD